MFDDVEVPWERGFIAGDVVIYKRIIGSGWTGHIMQQTSIRAAVNQEFANELATPLVEAQMEGQAKAHGIPREQVIRDVLLAQQPNKRFATTDELGGIAVFLCSDAAASITGAGIPVDGGWTAH